MKKAILALLAAAALPFAAQAQVVDAVQADGFGLKLVYPAVHVENAKVQEMINKDIAAYVDGMKAKYDAQNDVSMSYAAKFEDKKYVSLVMSASVMERGAANPENFEHGVVYSKVTGERVPLSAFVRVKSVNSLVKNLKKGAWKLYDQEGKAIAFNAEFVPEKLSDEFYLADAKTVAVIYQQGDLAPYSEGATRVISKRR
ncbi:hypothetical protein RAH42_09015 [Pyramidobacter sp. YE332]|uniref:hypothetical protein n=1 Tax=Pyramidobacter sp. YE332 TaxID=3068894 RepID=UPI00294B49B8|nr:hypothetical protein [Pyramidobacter sp. YE332]WOL39282.1 hypothetical protein RAH42_09015 [Pyramidobacter sp. YE332]